MASTEVITAPLIQESIVSAIQNVCRTMMGKEAKLRPEVTENSPLPTFELMANVGFTGEVNGVVYLCLSADFASYATGQILGMSQGEVAMHGIEVVNDAMSEVTNMTAGGFKNKLCDIGFPCKLTLPTIVRGKGLTIIANKGTVRHIFEFDCAGHILMADIQFKLE